MADEGAGGVEDSRGGAEEVEERSLVLNTVCWS